MKKGTFQAVNKPPNPPCQGNITRSATSKNYEGAQLSTALSGVDDKSLNSVAHSKIFQDEQMREGFIPSSAPGKVGRNLNTPYSSL